ncbi:MAG: hypothetical protein WBC44_00835 [Planctomycetaceae bacterium]
MTKIGKALVVFVTVMSLAFVAFVFVTTLGGPNWQAKAEQLDDYSFEATGTETPQWKVTARVTGKELGTKPYLPDAIRSAQNDLVTNQQQRITELDQKIKLTQETLVAEKAASAVDVQGIETRLAQLSEETARLDQQVLALTQQGTEAAQQAERLRTEAGARRADVARLQGELAQVRTDRYRLSEQIQQLQRRLVRLGGQIDRAERRQTQLQEQSDDYVPETGG